MTTHLDQRSVRWAKPGRTTQQADSTAGSASRRQFLGVGIAVVVGAVGLTAFLRGASPTSDSKVPEVQTVPSHDGQPKSSPPPATRNPYSREIAEITSLIQQGKYATASDLAEAHLRNQADPPSVEARTTLAGLSYNATMSGLYVPAEDLGQAAFTRWRDAHVRAEVYGVNPRTAPLTVSQTAAGASLWLLARGAFLKAWESGSVKPTDLNEVSNYYALLRNLGGAMRRHPSTASKDQALMFLQTADSISEGYGLGRGEARGDLTEILGPDDHLWPKPLEDDPVLVARLKR